MGNILTLQQGWPTGVSHSYTYDAQSQLTAETNSVYGTWSYT